ncbi:MAG: Zn-ribbon domain-containing OB-fold protein [Thermoplasmatales archaeon]|nr:Zn-ribbon domain-containing OB-fold protein [Thermoplasmatales archaeon]
MSAPRFWREINQRYNLVGTECGNCGKKYFPIRSVCPECHRESIGKMKKVKFSGNGKVFSYTVIHVGSSMFQMQTPYIMAIIELDEGPRITGQIIDCETKDVKIGMPVESVFRKIGEDGKSGTIYYGYKFRLMK